MIDVSSEQQVRIRAGEDVLEGLLTFPARARAGVIFCSRQRQQQAEPPEPVRCGHPR